MDEVLPNTATVNDLDHLSVGGCDVVELVERFGTPTIVFDRATFEQRARAYASALAPGQVFYAAKAFCCIAVCELLDGLGLGLDVCTGGELATAEAVAFPAERIIFHGNNKSLEELEIAGATGVGRVVLDSFEEIDLLAAAGISTRLLVRITPGVEAHTHEFVQTGQEDSKFGFGLTGGLAVEAVARASRVRGCELVGVHAHLGSQIFELAAFDLAVKRLADLLARVRSDLGFEARELNLGGGLGIAHTHDEIAPEPAEAVGRILAAIDREFVARDLTAPRVFVEPGRSIVGPAAVTVYRVGSVKRVPGVRTYARTGGGTSGTTSTKGSSTEKVFVAVDGGMGDNIRPALYGARYEALLANRMSASSDMRADVVGRFCESGDFLIKDAHLPSDVQAGDLLAVPATGAYTYSMASNYNRQPRPAVVLVADEIATEIVVREGYGDLLRFDRRLGGLDT
jgi:diaminopimelate decarboxylase